MFSTYLESDAELYSTNCSKFHLKPRFFFPHTDFRSDSGRRRSDLGLDRSLRLKQNYSFFVPASHNHRTFTEETIVTRVEPKVDSGASCDLIVCSPGCTLTYPWARWMAETWKCHRNWRISCMQICLLAYALHAKIEQMGLWVSELLLKNPNHWLSAFKERDGLLEVGRADERSAMFVSFPIMSHSGHEPPTSQTGNPPNTQYTLICTHPQVVKTEDWWIKKLSTGVVQAFTWLYFFSFLLF